MAVSNSLVKKETKVGFSAFITSDAIKNRINQMVGGKDGQRFITSIISAPEITWLFVTIYAVSPSFL